MSLLDKTNLLITPNAVKAGKLYSVIPSNGSGDCTVVRNTTATRVNNLGFIETVGVNVPRLNYAVAGGQPSILDEPQRTNLILQSEGFDTANWSKTGLTITSNNSTSPSNTNTGDTINEGTSSSTHEIAGVVSVVAGLSYVFSIYVKYINSRYFGFNSNFSGFGSEEFATYDLIGLTVSQQGASGTSGIINAGNGWYRLFRVLTATNTTNTNAIWSQRNGSATGRVNSFIGANLTTALWGAQVEQASTISSYIPTTSASATRNADVITVSPPSGTVKITTTFSNNTTQVITSIPTTYTMPEGLIKQVLMQSSL